MDECTSAYYPSEVKSVSEPKGMINVQLDHEVREPQKHHLNYRKIVKIVLCFILICIVSTLSCMILMNDTLSVSYIIPTSQPNNVRRLTDAIQSDRKSYEYLMTKYFLRSNTNLRKKRQFGFFANLYRSGKSINGSVHKHSPTQNTTSITPPSITQLNYTNMEFSTQNKVIDHDTQNKLTTIEIATKASFVSTEITDTKNTDQSTTTNCSEVTTVSFFKSDAKSTVEIYDSPESTTTNEKHTSKTEQQYNTTPMPKITSEQLNSASIDTDISSTIPNTSISSVVQTTTINQKDASQSTMNTLKVDGTVQPRTINTMFTTEGYTSGTRMITGIHSTPTIIDNTRSISSITTTSGTSQVSTKNTASTDTAETNKQTTEIFKPSTETSSSVKAKSIVTEFLTTATSSLPHSTTFKKSETTSVKPTTSSTSETGTLLQSTTVNMFSDTKRQTYTENTITQENSNTKYATPVISTEFRSTESTTKSSAEYKTTTDSVDSQFNKSVTGTTHFFQLSTEMSSAKDNARVTEFLVTGQSSAFGKSISDSTSVATETEKSVTQIPTKINLLKNLHETSTPFESSSMQSIGGLSDKNGRTYTDSDELQKYIHTRKVYSTTTSVSNTDTELNLNSVKSNTESKTTEVEKLSTSKDFVTDAVVNTWQKETSNVDFSTVTLDPTSVVTNNNRNEQPFSNKKLNTTRSASNTEEPIVGISHLHINTAPNVDSTTEIAIDKFSTYDDTPLGQSPDKETALKLMTEQSVEVLEHLDHGMSMPELHIYSNPSISGNVNKRGDVYPNTNSETSTFTNLKSNNDQNSTAEGTDTFLQMSAARSASDGTNSRSANNFALNEKIHTNQGSIESTTFNKMHCPSFASPLGFSAFQQASAYPYMYNLYGSPDYAKLFAPPTNSYILQQYPYGGMPFGFPYSQLTKTASNGAFFPYNGNLASTSTVPVQAFGPGGQYYVCNPVPALMGTEEIPDTNIRHTSEDNIDQISKEEEITLQSFNNCPEGEKMCKDGSKCIKDHQICDGDVQCKDASDEVACTCKYRILSSRNCDGYTDCPDGEDEKDCFGCTEETFSCDDWSLSDRTATCIPLEQRCDGVAQCSTGKDEDDCSILTESFTLNQAFAFSQTSGFLFRNFKGSWYPVCSNAERWANDVCQIESGPNAISPLTHLATIKIPYKGKYLSASAGKINVVESCVEGAAVFVECPPLVCGMRLKIRNPFRPEEVDISAEEFSPNRRLAENSDNESAIVGISRVVGGKPSQPGAWPWVVSVYRNGVFHCGGVLVNENWIVTAAHCIDKYWHYHYEVQAGILRRFSFTPMEQGRVVSHILGHNLYDRANLKNDLALMRLAAPLKFNRYIRPICLPSEITAGPNFAWGPVPGTTCIVVGWGAMKEHGSDPDHLREVEVPVKARCKYREDQEGNEICAGLREGGKDACQGDSGGPFMCRNPSNPNQWYLAGIVSHGEGCARPNEPGVYTRVSMYLNWIFDHMSEDSLPQRRPLKKCPGYVCKDTNRCISNKRRCDRIVDCLRGDDELNCEHTNFADIFKHAMRNFYSRSSQNQTQENSFNATETCTDCQATDEDMTNVTVGSSQTHFQCTTIYQLINFEKRCDKMVDCEDGSDEKHCLCLDYLTNSHPEAICDGVTDCEDYSDEFGCDECKTDEFYCRLSKTCIPLKKKCNTISDCLSSEDEWDCFALTNGKNVYLGGDFRPELNNTGLVTLNQDGNWTVVCYDWSDIGASIASGICIYLGYEDYDSFSAINLNFTSNITGRSQLKEPILVPENCTALFVKCLNQVTSMNTVLKDENVTYFEDFHATPWNAAIYVDGDFKCTGVVFDFSWIITSTNCISNTFKLDLQYAAILVGVGRAHLNVIGPHEQTIPVTEVLYVEDTDIVLLRLERSVEYSRYVHSLHFRQSHDQQYDETCIATGHDFSNIMRLVLLKSLSNCTEGHKCFIRVDTPEINCNMLQHRELEENWSGIVTCKSRNGWYPVAVFNETRGSCGFSGNLSYTNFTEHQATIRSLMQQAPSRVHPPPCNGLRCNLGRCVEPHKVCDGVPDCRNGMDERDEFCLQRRRDCHHSVACVCLNSELKCANGKCVPKTSFCDKTDDCGDGSDEPATCNCASYLHLTNSTKICDGIIHCEDRSDEDSRQCGCKSDSFSCGNTNYCVSKQSVCDGVKDCPNNEDEDFCLSENNFGSVKQIIKRTSGIWHPGCFSKHLSTSQLEKICSDVGYLGGSGTRIFRGGNNDTALRPILDEFQTLWINKDGPNEVILKMRSGIAPYVSFRPDSSCYKLFLSCL